MNITLFISDFMTVMAEEETIRPFIFQQLQELMEDMKLYGWKSIQSFHAVWLQQLEQGKAA